MTSFSVVTRVGSGLLCLVIAMGCGGNGPVDPTKTGAAVLANADLVQAKSRLTQIASSGNNAPSNMYGISDALKKGGKPELLGELEKVVRAKKSDEVKKLAADLAAKL